MRILGRVASSDADKRDQPAADHADRFTVNADRSPAYALQQYLQLLALFGIFHWLCRGRFNRRLYRFFALAGLMTVFRNVEPASLEDDGRGLKDASRLCFALGAKRHGGVIKTLSYIKMRTATITLVFVNRHV